MHKVPTLTLGSIRKAGPCGVGDKKSGFGLLLTNLGQPMVRYKKDLELTLGDVAASNDAKDAWWCVKAINYKNIETRRAVLSVLLKSCCRAAKHTTDRRVHECLDALDRWCGGDDTVDLAAARDAARNAAHDAAWGAKQDTSEDAAWAAAWAAREDTVEDSAWAAALAAVWAAAGAAARKAKEGASRDAAWGAARKAELALQRAELIAAFPPMHIVD